MEIESIVNPGFEVYKTGNDVYTVLDAEFAEKLTAFLSTFETIQKKEQGNLILPNEYPDLPFGKAGSGKWQWKFRQNTFHIVKRELRHKKNAAVLEIGGWNGWLTHHLANWCKHVISVDYFIDEVNGLHAKKYYKENWTAIQMNIAEPAIFKKKFDVIIVNHCLQFFQEPGELVKKLKELVADEGMIIITGIQIFKNPSKKEVEVETFKNYYRSKYNFNILFTPSKAFFDLKDQQKMKQEGIVFKYYPGLWIKNILAAVYPTKPLYFYATWAKKSSRKST